MPFNCYNAVLYLTYWILDIYTLEGMLSDCNVGRKKCRILEKQCGNSTHSTPYATSFKKDYLREIKIVHGIWILAVKLPKPIVVILRIIMQPK